MAEVNEDNELVISNYHETIYNLTTNINRESKQ